MLYLILSIIILGLITICIEKQLIKNNYNKLIENKNTMKCYFCNSEMITSGIDSKEELGLDGQGSVINFTCSKCDSTCEFVEGETNGTK